MSDDFKIFNETDENDRLCDLRNKAFIKSEFGGNFRVSSEFKNDFHNNNYLSKECNNCKKIRNISRTNNIRGVNCKKCTVFDKTCSKCILTYCDRCVDLVLFCNNCLSRKKSTIKESIICNECFDKPHSFFIYNCEKEQPIEGIINKISNIFYPERHKILMEYKELKIDIKCVINKIDKEIKDLEKSSLNYEMLMKEENNNDETDDETNDETNNIKINNDELENELENKLENESENNSDYGIYKFNYDKCIKRIEFLKNELQKNILLLAEEGENVKLKLDKLSICEFDHLNYDNQYKDLHVFENLINPLSFYEI